MYDKPAGNCGVRALAAELLATSLRKTLDSYPQWAGQLHYAPYTHDAVDHTKRFGRLQITHGAESDPGVEFVVIHHPAPLASLVPDAASRASGLGAWDAAGVKRIGLLPDSPRLALYDKATYAGLPCMIIQITYFSCGGVAVTIALAHPLADAQALLKFAQDWAAHNRTNAPGPVDGISTLQLPPVFDPQQLDRTAAGDIDAILPDPDILDRASDVPLHRHDWWASEPGCPPRILSATRVPAVLQGSPLVGALGKPLPWAEWDRAAPVAHYLVHFGPSELQRIWEAATADAGRVSRLDALLSHMWALIARARGLADDDAPVHFDVSIGLRSRLQPPLADAFLGSPILSIPVTVSGREAAAGRTAGVFRAALKRYDAAALAAVLYEAMYAAAPQRYWHAFLGRRHTIVTSWLRLGVYEVDFVGGTRPRYVEAVMPENDGCLQVMEAGGDVMQDGGQRAQWYDDGASVSLHLREDVMEKLLKDPLLRKYRDY